MAVSRDWQTHVDSQIADDGKQFLSAARVLLYGKVHTEKDEKTDFFRKIGVVQGYSWSEQRNIEMVFELGSDIPYLIPGRTMGQIQITRMLLYGADLLNLLYQKDGVVQDDAHWIRSLKDIDKPLDLLFAAFPTSNDRTNPTYTRVFNACWIQARNESIAAGQILVAENVSIIYQNVTQISLDDLKGLKSQLNP